MNRRKFLSVCFGGLTSGCAIAPRLDPSPRSSNIVSGRFSFTASFMNEVSQGRFEWRVLSPSVGLREPGQDRLVELWVLDPWNQPKAVFFQQQESPGPWSGWWLSDIHGKTLDKQDVLGWSRESGLSPQSLKTLAFLLNEVNARLRALNGVSPAGPLVLKHEAANKWVELRLIPDRDTQ